MIKEFYSPVEVFNILGVHVKTIRRHMRQKILGFTGWLKILL